MKTKNNHYSSEKILSISAIFIAVVSIVIGIWQGIETRKHNRLSVQPRLELFYSQDYHDKTVKFIIQNNGLGPAIITEVIAIVDSVEYKINQTNKLFELLVSLGIQKIPITYDLLMSGTTLKPTDARRIVLIKMEYLEKSGVLPDDLGTKISFIVKYTSLYGEEFECYL
ncbi:MAG: hypothetical protein K8R41_06895 [Bacteroidales bacterium]|nr:hypothetical protein [Bacteroidales bacterium]